MPSTVDRAASASDGSPRTPTTPLPLSFMAARAVPTRNVALAYPKTNVPPGVPRGARCSPREAEPAGHGAAIADDRGPVDR
ncbi:hypothetical protein [Dictyobacter halimunensis]|uniref:hypothetical protein n=1 Tax=Dictyobacter halimunensis TaxID=3026934 RepID=UPI0030C6ECE4